MSDPRSVLVVDDQAPFRLAARAALRRLDGFEFAGEAASGPEAVELVGARIVATCPEVAVILCSTHDPNDPPADAASSGAIAYVRLPRLPRLGIPLIKNQ